MDTSKRNLIKAAAALGFSPSAIKPFGATLAAMAGLATHSARAANGDYKALVCLFMAGGNDSHNWLVPTDSDSYADYARGRSNLALAQSALTPLSSAPSQPSGRSFALARDLEPLRGLYEQGELAFVSNVGPLENPTSKADFAAGRNLPAKLFSHNDQQANWQSMSPEGARAGWGGRIADLLMDLNGQPLFTTVSAAGNHILLSGLQCKQYQINPAGPVGINGLTRPSTLGSSEVAAVMRSLQREAGTNAFQSSYSQVVQRSDEAYRLLSQAAGQVSMPPLRAPEHAVSTTGQPVDLTTLPLARQLRAVTQMMASHGTLGMKRQIFMVSMGGFDTHANLLRDQPLLMAGVASAVRAFMDDLRVLGLHDKVTLFSASDFGRTLTTNGSGSDHGWGSHHFVAGGAVRGRDIYGRFPNLALGGADDVGSGRLLPGISVVEYAAALGNWFGVSNSDLATVLPNFGNFAGGGPRFLA